MTRVRPAHPARSSAVARPCSGIALLEALLAAALLASGAAGLLRLQGRLAWTGDEVRHQGEALWLAQQALEQSRETLQVPSTRWTGRSAAFDVQGEALDTRPDGQPGAAFDDPFRVRALRVRVTWTDRTGLTHGLDLHTLAPSANRSLTAWLTRADS